MAFILMVVGMLAIALGAILIGFGIPINEFSLGNTLILAGTVTATGGLVTFAISRAVAQLSRIAEMLAARPVAAAAAAPSAGAAASPPPRALQPRAPADEFEQPEKPEPVRPPSRSPIPPAEDMAAPPASPPPAPARAGWRPPRPAGPAATVRPPEPRRPAIPDVSAEAAPVERPDRPTPPLRREPKVETAAEPVTVLKSGVVDGMAYTLYTDGSIEAELAQGVVRFGSIEELRNHLEKNG
ncbi:hypothetical protein [Pseudorhodoplanes sp.]|uniref:hypothetical protein n=1 Tax=Pseudorhodoplanes sp. TaxID=1934341 RepID=UPI003918EAF1